MSEGITIGADLVRFGERIHPYMNVGLDPIIRSGRRIGGYREMDECVGFGIQLGFVLRELRDQLLAKPCSLEMWSKNIGGTTWDAEWPWIYWIFPRVIWWDFEHRYEQDRFVTEGVAGLAMEDHLIPVTLWNRDLLGEPTMAMWCKTKHTPPVVKQVAA